MAPTKARIRPTRRLIRETIGSALGPQSHMNPSRSGLWNWALPAKNRQSARNASPMKARTSAAASFARSAASARPDRKGSFSEVRRAPSRAGTAVASFSRPWMPAGRPWGSKVSPFCEQWVCSLSRKVMSVLSHAATCCASTVMRVKPVSDCACCSTSSAAGVFPSIFQRPDTCRRSVAASACSQRTAAPAPFVIQSDVILLSGISVSS